MHRDAHGRYRDDDDTNVGAFLWPFVAALFIVLTAAVLWLLWENW